MDIILPENVFDSRLESRSDSAENLFACLGPENMSDNGIQALNDTDADTVDEYADQTETLSSTVETTAEDSNTTEVLQSGTEGESKTEISSETRVNEFLPTIIDIRGACDDSSNQETPRTNTVDETIATNENDVACIINDADDADTHSISDTEKPSGCDNTNDKTDTVLNSNVVIKQEPRDEDVDNDCMLVDSNDVSTCFTSEIEIKEERINENNDNEVNCVETTSKIPLPIPIKIEANLDNDNEVSPTKPVKVQKSGNQTESSPTNSKNASTKLYSSAYRCHLCNTTFEEHELLNEHMKLHRNNSLIERYNKVYGNKTRKNSKYICRTCGKRLSTGQSLTQHMMIHNNEKPHVCPICKKDFRHLSNFKMHVQKHKEEEEQRRKQREKQKQMAKASPLPLPAPADRSVARSADFGRLVGPLFVKESLLKGSSSSEISRPMITPKTEYRKPFELKYTTKPSRHENVKENLIYYKKMTPSSYDEKYSRARKFNDDIGDDVIPLKTFNNVENIVMNATKLIVKVDNLDPNLLKKKIKTPDISIDKSASSVHNVTADRKRKIQISPSSEGAKRLKIDQIENIIMDSGDTTSTTALNHADDDESNVNLDFPSYYDDDDDDVGASSSVNIGTGPAKQETLTTNELFELLNDDRDSRDAFTDHLTTSPTKTSSLVADELAKIVSSPVKSTPPKSSNVIVLKSPSSRRPVASQPSPIPVVNPPVLGSSIRESSAKPQTPVETPARMPVSPTRSIKSIDLTKDTPPKEPQNKVMNLIDDEDADEDDILVDKCDTYDNAFRNVALRRLTLIRKIAAENGGKVENRYLLGPLFWRKALRKAKRNQLTREPSMTLHEAKLAYKRMNAMKFGKQDTRRTNDPAKLQQRAELKLQYILGRVKVMSDVNHLNLAGPLFWKRTLKLAGVHDPNDLKGLLVDEGLTINDIEFVTTKVTEPSSVESSTSTTMTTTIIPTPTADMNGDVTIIDDDDSSKSSSIANPITSIADISTNIYSVASNVPRSTLESLPSPLLSSSISGSEEKSPVALTGSDFLENIVVQRKTSQPITNGGHNSIVDGILNDDLLKPKTVEKPSAVTTPVLTKSSPLSSVQVLKTIADSTKEPIQQTVTKAESILYDSLTKPRGTAPSIVSLTSTRTVETFDDNSRMKSESCSLLNTSTLKPSMGPIIKRNNPVITAASTATTASRSLLASSTNWATNTTKNTPSRASTSTTTKITRQLSPPPVQSRLVPALVASAPEMDNRVVSLITSSTTTPSAPASAAVAVVADTAEHQQIEVPDSTTALEAGGNIILNVDSADFQLIADSKNENGQETNYVLVSDGNGGVQLIKENDFRLLEDAGATSNASHYIVNVPNDENFANFDLMSNAAGANGEQLAYIQLDNENYTTLQFIQDTADVALEDPLSDATVAIADKQKIMAGEKNVTIGGTNYVIAADPSADLNHIGKELSDFLHIDYGTLLKNDNQHQQT